MRKQLLAALAALCTALLFSGPALAESYVGGYAGVAVPRSTDVTDTSGINVPPLDELEFGSGLAVGVKAGHWLTERNAPYLGVELDFNGHFAELKNTSQANGVKWDLAGDMTVYSVTASILLRIPDGQVRPYAGVGVGWFFADIDDAEIVGIPFKGDDDNSFGYQAIAGVDIPIGANASVFAEVRHSFVEFDFDGEVDLDGVEYNASQFYGGVAFRF